MSDRRLRVFQAVARLGSFSLAAKQMGMTQPAVSFQVRQLETHLGCQLIDRSTRNLTLTPAGELALQYSERINQLGDEMERDIRALVATRPDRVAEF